MASTASTKTLSWRLGIIALIAVVVTILIGVGALTMARFDMIEKLTGFRTFMGTQTIALAGGALGVVALVFGLVRKNGPKWPGALAALLGAGLAGIMYVMVAMPASQVPPIHDVTTDVDDPPQFVLIDVEPISTGPFSVEEWRAFHQDAYSDIEPILVQDSPVNVLARARALMEERGWEIAGSDPAAGRLEATAFAGYLKFRDDVVIEVTPVEDGSTRVDMRSVSQVGVSDLGYNAARIRDFLADLAAG
jgi:uncharacterized protein (DUF1499 family)